MSFRRALPVLAVLLLLALLTAATFTRVVQLRTDMADFLPPGDTPASRLLIGQLRTGAAASLLLIGVEGAPPAELARLSQATAQGLRASHLFSLVANGGEGFDEAEQDFLFGHRYLLSPAVTADSFAVPSLRARFQSLLDQLAGSAAPLVKRFGVRDPTGSFLDLLQVWAGGSPVELREGVWFAPGGARALLLARTSASSLDVEAARASLDALSQAFATAKPEGARLVVSGPATFALQSADAIRGDVRFISILSGVLLTAFLLWRHRSVYVLAAAAIPLLCGVIAGALLVQLVHGFMHGITLGFGMTMLGVAADYPLLLIGQRREGEGTLMAARRIWPTMLLAVLTAALGLTAMLLSSFPGLAQLGLFSGAGLLTAALVTRFLLPHLVSDVAFRGQQVSPGWLRAAAALRRRRAWLIAPAVLAALWLALTGGVPWERELENLSPVPRAARDLDETLRHELGAPDIRHLVAIGGADQEAVLQACERLDGVVDRLTAQGAVGGVELPCRYLPSRRTQDERRAILPEAGVLAARVAEAGTGLPFRAQAFAGFIDDVQVQRGLPALTRADLTAPTLAARLDPLLFQQSDGWHGLAALTDVRDADAVRAAIETLNDPALAYVDLKEETEGMVNAYTRQALRWLAAGALLLALVLAAALRRPARVGRVVLPILGAVLVTLAVLDALGIRLTLFHLASLLLMTGVSIDYALFLNRPPEAHDDDSRTLGSVLNCNAATLLTFGLLTLCRNPVLQGIGVTVAVGVLAAVILSIGLSREPRPLTGAG